MYNGGSAPYPVSSSLSSSSSVVQLGTQANLNSGSSNNSSRGAGSGIGHMSNSGDKRGGGSDTYRLVSPGDIQAGEFLPAPGAAASLGLAGARAGEVRGVTGRTPLAGVAAAVAATTAGAAAGAAAGGAASEAATVESMELSRWISGLDAQHLPQVHGLEQTHHSSSLSHHSHDMGHFNQQHAAQSVHFSVSDRLGHPNDAHEHSGSGSHYHAHTFGGNSQFHESTQQATAVKSFFRPLLLSTMNPAEEHLPHPHRPQEQEHQHDQHEHEREQYHDDSRKEHPEINHSTAPNHDNQNSHIQAQLPEQYHHQHPHF
jgi:hypothetical protein